MKRTTRISPAEAATITKDSAPSSRSASRITSKPQRSDANIVTLDPSFSRRIVGVFGKEGATWLARLPRTLDEIAAQWQLSLQLPFDDLSYNFVAPATTADGEPAVLKLGVPNPELQTEIQALRDFDGRGAARLLQAAPEKGALLLERLDPGRTLLEMEDDEVATAILCRVIQRLNGVRVSELHYPSMEDWGGGFSRLREHFDGGTGPFPNDMLVRAESLYLVMSASSGERYLLHGDLQHGNVLSAERDSWLAIDPKGVIGEPEYEAGAWMRNPVDRLQSFNKPAKVLARRVDHFVSELGFDRERVMSWAFAQAVLAAWWAYEDEDKGWARFIEWAEILGELK